MQKRKALIISVILALFAAVLLQAYLVSLERRYKAGARPIDVLVAKGYIPERTLLTEHMVVLERIPSEHVAPKALTAVNQLWNVDGIYIYATVVPIERGEQIVTTKLVTPGRDSGIAMVVPEGKRAITIPVDDVTGVANLIMPGNRVDVLVSLEGEPGDPAKTVTLFQNIQVLAVKDNLAVEVIVQEAVQAPEAHEMGAMPVEVTPTVTLALTPSEAQTLAHALVSGIVRLSVRGLGDDVRVTLGSATRAALR